MANQIKEFNDFQKKFIPFATLKRRLLMVAPPGKGKTLAFLGLFSLLRKKNAVQRAIVFTKQKGVPAFKKNNVVGVKILEIRKAEDITRMKSVNPDAYDLYVVSTSLLKEFRTEIHVFSRKCDMLIIDEIHDYRNYKNQSYITLRNIAVEFYRKPNTRTLAITASPVYKDPTDLFQTFNLFVPGLLGSYYVFCSRYAQTRDRQIYVKSSVRSSTGTSKVRNNRMITEIVGFKNIDELYEIIRPYMFVCDDFKFTFHPKIHYYKLEESRDEYNKVIQGLGLDMLYHIEYLHGTKTCKFFKLNTERVEVQGKGLVKPSELRRGDTLVIRQSATERTLHAVDKVYKTEAVGDWSARLHAAQRTMSTNPDKLKKLKELIQPDKGALVFCQYLETADKVAAFLRRNFPGRKVEILSGKTRDFDQKVARLSSADLVVITKVASQSVDFYYDQLIIYEMVIQPGFMDQLAGRLTRENSPYTDIMIDILIGLMTTEEYFYERLRYMYKSVRNSHIKDKLPPSQTLGGHNVRDIAALKDMLLGGYI